MDTMYLMGSNIATFILAWVVSGVVAKHHALKEQATRDAELQKTQAWVNYLTTLQGGRHE